MSADPRLAAARIRRAARELNEALEAGAAAGVFASFAMDRPMQVWHWSDPASSETKIGLPRILPHDLRLLDKATGEEL